MRREELVAALRRAKIVASLRELDGAAARARALRAWAAAGRTWAGVRRRPDVAVAAALCLGVLAMILHWR